MATNSRILDIRGRGLKLETAEHVAPLLEGYNPQAIEEIHLGGNTIGVDASIAFASFLKKTTVLKVADFADIFTGRLITEIPQALTALCDALKDKSTLIEINLSDNAYGERSVKPMIPLLTHNRFEILRLNNNGLGPAGGTEIANALAESARLSTAEGKKSNLKTVICGRNRLENGSASAWAEAFAAHGTLVEVRLPQNGIRMHGIRELAEGLSKCPDLQYLDLQDNTFTEDGSKLGVESWANVLPHWPALETLNLSDCVLSNEGEVPLLLRKLAEGSNRKITTLQLQNNNLEAKTFELLANSISTHLSGLKFLELQWNDVEEDDENLDTIRAVLRERKGRILVTDEDEEEEEETEGEPSEDTKAAVNALADMIDKVNIQ
ncbi:hypothetical protein F5I97DRAFT_1810608 [Phlebopus sp. FC_14]|nr:hypothetical protein F5I97DRAFT_1810608 [Phlebopus sp. FC_14]